VTAPAAATRLRARRSTLQRSRRYRAVGFAGLTVAMFPLDRIDSPAGSQREIESEPVPQRIIKRSRVPCRSRLDRHRHCLICFAASPPSRHRDLGWHGTERSSGGATAGFSKDLRAARPFVTAPHASSRGLACDVTFHPAAADVRRRARAAVTKRSRPRQSFENPGSPPQKEPPRSVPTRSSMRDGW